MPLMHGFSSYTQDKEIWMVSEGQVTSLLWKQFLSYLLTGNFLPTSLKQDKFQLLLLCDKFISNVIQSKLYENACIFRANFSSVDDDFL